MIGAVKEMGSITNNWVRQLQFCNIISPKVADPYRKLIKHLYNLIVKYLFVRYGLHANLSQNRKFGRWHAGKKWLKELKEDDLAASQ